MGACLGKISLPATAPWPDLPPEIADLIFCRLPSHDDRLSFGAVCHDWRLAARQQLLLPMPCINLGYGAYQSLVDGKVRCFPTAKGGYRVGASFGGWLFIYNEGSKGRCFLGDPFSSVAAIEVPTCYHKSLVDFPMAVAWGRRTLVDTVTVLVGLGMDMKMILCSSDLIVALFRHPDEDISYLASFQPAESQQRLIVSSWFVQPYEDDYPAKYVYMDIAFYRGQVFALSCREELFCHDFSVAEVDTDGHLLPVVYHDGPQVWQANSYLVVSADKKKLLMVRLTRRNDHRAMDLWVFQADFDKGRWLEVKDLDAQVLFIGRNSSMAFATDSSELWSQKFRGGNRVFVHGDEWARSSGQPLSCKRDTPSYCVYDMVSGETSMVWLKGARYMESCTSGWFFPQE